MSDKDKAAPVGDLREAFEAAYAKCVDDGWTSVKHLGRKMFEAGAAHQRAQQPQSAEAVAWIPATTYPTFGEIVLTNIGLAYMTEKQPGVWFKRLENLGMGTRLGAGAVKQWREIDTPQPSAGVVVPAGWKLVPVEPTLEMAEAVYFDGVDYTHGFDFDDFKKAWPLLLAVAPHPHTTAQGGKTVHDLLAVIHRDGGHYEHEHGTGKALADAMEVVNKERVEADDWRHAASAAALAEVNK